MESVCLVAKMEQKRIIHIELLRIFSLLCVILFHAIGMLYNKFPLEKLTFLGNKIQQISILLVGIAVPLFMFIAGYLYKPVKRKEIIIFIRKKVVRLLLPYTLFTVLIMLSSGFFSFTMLLGGGFYHLWFLTALFWCFMISICINYSKRITFLILPVSLGCSMICLPEFLGIQDFVQWYYYFVLGALIKSHPRILTIIRRYYIGIPFILFYIIIVSLIPFHYRVPSILHSLAISVLIIAVWGLIERVDNINIIKKYNKVILSIGKCSMGIYILHYWFLIYLLSNTVLQIFKISMLIKEHLLLIILMITLIAFTFCYIVTMICRKNKYGKVLLG